MHLLLKFHLRVYCQLISRRSSILTDGSAFPARNRVAVTWKRGFSHRLTARPWASRRMRHVVQFHKLHHFGNPALLHKGRVRRMVAVKGIGCLVSKLH